MGGGGGGGGGGEGGNQKGDVRIMGMSHLALQWEGLIISRHTISYNNIIVF